MVGGSRADTREALTRRPETDEGLHLEPIGIRPFEEIDEKHPADLDRREIDVVVRAIRELDRRSLPLDQQLGQTSATTASELDLRAAHTTRPALVGLLFAELAADRVIGRVRGLDGEASPQCRKADEVEEDVGRPDRVLVR